MFDPSQPLEESLEEGAKALCAEGWNGNVTEYAILAANIGSDDAALVWSRAAWLWSEKAGVPFWPAERVNGRGGA
jgi:hypothetical protein